jgi:hypothetical protein
MRAEAESADRDPDLLELTLGHHLGRITADRAGELAGLGTTRLVLSPSPHQELERVKDELSACADRLGITPREHVTSRG